MSVGTSDVRLGMLGPSDAPALREFAAQRPLPYADFASMALVMPSEPTVWTAVSGGRIVAAAIDDGLAMSVAGEHDALGALAAHVGDVSDKLVIAGRRAEVEAFVGSRAAARRSRPEHFMAVDQAGLAFAAEQLPLRVAEDQDVALLVDARTRALEEEYAIDVERGGRLHKELERAVRRAVDMRGVAVWVEHGRIAFTAQLIAKTEDAAMFGDLYTDPELRGAGRATRALTAFCSWLMTESRHVVLRVGMENVRAVRLYERCGFQVIDEFLSSLRVDD